MANVLLKNIENPNSHRIDEYVKAGGYFALEHAINEMTPKDIVDDIRKSGLRGRGGAGFSTGMKWQFASLDPKFPKYIVCNADEGEPGTFKDRVLLERNPHRLIEGMVITAYALQSIRGYIYVRAEYPHVEKILNEAIKEAYDKGFLGDDIMSKHFRFNLSVHRGAGAYICGEETALINSLEGRRGEPRIKPPFPVNSGAWSKPTIVNNVETYANIPYIIETSPKAYTFLGTKDAPGTKLFCVSGAVNKPGVYELELGTPLREIIYDHCGGIRGGRALKGVIPGGLSTSILTPDKIDCPMDFANLAKRGSMLGSGAIIVLDDTMCIVKIYERAMRFFEHESCGKCTPCREGTGWMRTILSRIEKGLADMEDLATLEDVAANVAGKTFCPLGEGAAHVLLAVIKSYRGEFEYHVKYKKCEVADPSQKWEHISEGELDRLEPIV